MALVAALRALPEDKRHADWSEWRGIKGNLDAPSAIHA
jgi:hypothetical protein